MVLDELLNFFDLFFPNSGRNGKKKKPRMHPVKFIKHLNMFITIQDTERQMIGILIYYKIKTNLYIPNTDKLVKILIWD